MPDRIEHRGGPRANSGGPRPGAGRPPAPRLTADEATALLRELAPDARTPAEYARVVGCRVERVREALRAGCTEATAERWRRARCDTGRISHLYQMAIEAHQGTTVWSLRHAALDGIRAEVAKQPGVVDWLRDRTCLAMEPFTVPGLDGTTWWMVLVRDETISTGGSRGTPAPTVEESAASALVWHLAAIVGQAFRAESYGASVEAFGVTVVSR